MTPVNSVTMFTHVFFLILILFVRLSDAHGQMCEPRQRGAYTTAGGRCKDNKDIGQSNIVVDYCPHCLSGGTVTTVLENLPPSGWSTYDPISDIATAQRAGLCGDARGSTYHLLGGKFVPPRYKKVPIVSVAKTGGTIDFSIQIDTNHNGYFEFFLCDLDGCGTADIDESCFSKGYCYKLERVAHPKCEKPATNTQHFCAPIDKAYPGRWYIPCRGQRIIVGGDEGTMRYKLPDGVTCKHCVVQWYWATANGCNPVGQKAYIDDHFRNIQSLCNSIRGGLIASNQEVPECGGSTVPEEFWSCGDIQISKGGNSLGPVPIGRSTFTPSSPSTPNPNPSTVLSFMPPTPSFPISGSRPSTDPSASTYPSIVDPTRAPTVTPSVSDVTVTEEPSPSSSTSEIGTRTNQCVADGAACDGAEPCCDLQFVCVHTIRADGFTCRRWKSLWKEVRDRRTAERLSNID